MILAVEVVHLVLLILIGVVAQVMGQLRYERGLTAAVKAGDLAAAESVRRHAERMLAIRGSIGLVLLFSWIALCAAGIYQ